MAYQRDVYQYVKLTLKNKFDSTDTLTLYIGNRPAYDETSITIFPALIRISGLSTGTSQNVPRIGAGTIEIDNRRGLFGVNKRFSDFLDKYTVTYQDVEVYTNLLASDDSAANTGDTLLWVDKVLRVSQKNDRVTLNLRTDLINDREACALIDTEIFPDAVAAGAPESLGKVVPVVFGQDQYVRPVKIDRQNSGGYTNRINYGYATTLADDFVNGGIQEYYAKDYKGDYALVKSAAANNTPVFGTAYSSPTSHTTYSHLVSGFSYELVMPSDGAYILLWWGLSFYKSASTPSDEQITVGVYTDLFEDVTSDAVPRELIASGGVINASDLSTGYNDVSNSFDKPVIAQAGEHLAFAWTSNYGDTSTPASNRLEITDLTSTHAGAFQNNPINGKVTDGRWVPASGTTGLTAPLFYIYAAKLTDNATPTAGYIKSNGLGISNFDTDTWFSFEPDLTNVDWLLKVNGLKDNGSGTITGSANAVIEMPDDIAKVLSYTYNGTIWSAGNFDATTYSSTHTQFSSSSYNSYRIVGGATRGQTTVRNVLSEICRETQSYLVRAKGTNKIALFGTGTEQTVSAIITDEDIIGSVEYDIDDRTSVLTAVKAVYGRSLVESNFTDVITQGGDATFQNFLELRYDDADIGQLLSANAKNLFGELPNKKPQFNWISDTTSITNLLRLMLEAGQVPTETAKVEVLYTKYGTLKLFDKIEIVSSELPQTGGTNPLPLNPVYNGAEQLISEYNSELVLAKPYHALITDIKYNFEKKAPTMTITTRLKVNQAEVI